MSEPIKLVIVPGKAVREVGGGFGVPSGVILETTPPEAPEDYLESHVFLDRQVYLMFNPNPLKQEDGKILVPMDQLVYDFMSIDSYQAIVFNCRYWQLVSRIDELLGKNNLKEESGVTRYFAENHWRSNRVYELSDGTTMTFREIDRGPMWDMAATWEIVAKGPKADTWLSQLRKLLETHCRAWWR